MVKLTDNEAERGRPGRRKGVSKAQVNARLSEEGMAKLREVAKRRGVTVTALMEERLFGVEVEPVASRAKEPPVPVVVAPTPPVVHVQPVVEEVVRPTWAEKLAAEDAEDRKMPWLKRWSRGVRAKRAVFTRSARVSELDLQVGPNESKPGERLK